MRKIIFFWEQVRVGALKMPTPLVLAGKIRNFSWQKYKVNIVAMIIYAIITTGITMFYEMGVSNGEIHQWFWVRVIYISLRTLGAPLLGQLIDYIRDKVDNEVNFLKLSWLFSQKTSHRILKGISDSISLSLFQIPIYIFAALTVGVDYQAVLVNSLMYIGDNFLLGWFFGYILDQTRKFFAKREKK